jgi:hypothetical protein
MPGIRTLVIRVEIDEALKAHNCQGNSKHRMERGARRLKVRKGRSWDHYCVPCALVILRRDIAELQALERQFQSVMR